MSDSLLLEKSLLRQIAVLDYNGDSTEDFFCLIAFSSNKRALSLNAENHDPSLLMFIYQ